jgi:hypothetical protein
MLSLLREGSIILDSAPDSPVASSTTLMSLWQLNLSALLVERYFGAEKVSSTAVAALINSNSYQTGISPP